uniref:Uncharacterized protein n=1 Tax=Sphaerodactylus townsendi TaxID=933632 RepID=A0ACB8EGK5_9SAUR
MSVLVSQAQDLLVSQPSSAQGTEGGSVTLRCSFSSTSKLKVGSYQWVKDPGVVVKNTTPEFMGRVICTSDQLFLSDRRADLEIRDLRHYDSGIYRCEVNIHGLQEAAGNGTELQVVKGADQNVNKKEMTVSLMIGLGAGLCSALAASAAVPLIVIYCKRRQGRRAKESRAERQSQDPEAKVEGTAMEDLNYVELIAIKSMKKPKTQKETVTYASVNRHSEHIPSIHSD